MNKYNFWVYLLFKPTKKDFNSIRDYWNYQKTLHYICFVLDFVSYDYYVFMSRRAILYTKQNTNCIDADFISAGGSI